MELNIDNTAGQACIDCKVNVQRISLSEPEESPRRLTYDRFAMPVGAQGEIELDRQLKEWEDLGEDKKLAGLILTKIEEKICKRKGK